MDLPGGTVGVWLVRAGCFVAGGLVGGALVAVWVHADLPMGSLAEWVAGLLTVGALVFAGLQLSSDLHVRQSEEERDAWAQASLVAPAFTSQSGINDQTGERLAYKYGTISVRNNSTREIFEVELKHQYGKDRITSAQHGRIAPGAEVGMRYDERWPPEERPDEEPIEQVSWSDVGGRRWTYTSKGLSRAGEKGPSRGV